MNDQSRITGLGPSLEFYNLVAVELQRKDLGMWVCDDDDGTGDSTGPSNARSDADATTDSRKSDDDEGDGQGSGGVASSTVEETQRGDTPSAVVGGDVEAGGAAAPSPAEAAASPAITVTSAAEDPPDPSKAPGCVAALLFVGFRLT
jgi:hypothetical protein